MASVRGPAPHSLGQQAPLAAQEEESRSISSEEEVLIVGDTATEIEDQIGEYLERNDFDAALIAVNFMPSADPRKVTLYTRIAEQYLHVIKKCLNDREYDDAKEYLKALDFVLSSYEAPNLQSILYQEAAMYYLQLADRTTLLTFYYKALELINKAQEYIDKIIYPKEKEEAQKSLKASEALYKSFVRG